MSAPTGAETEARLRYAYRVVASSTTVEPPPRTELAVVASTMNETHRRRTGWAAAASVVLVVTAVGSLVWIAATRDSAAADSVARLTGEARHATLSTIPEGLGLVAIDTGDDLDVLEFAGGDRSLVVTTSRSDAASTVIIDGDVHVRAGRPASVATGDDGGTTIGWTEQPGVSIELVGRGDWSLDELLLLAEQVVMVSDDTWRSLVKYDGFAEVDHADRAVFDPSWRGPYTGGPLTRSVSGSLQTGVSVVLAGYQSFGVERTMHNDVWPGKGADQIVFAAPGVHEVRVVGGDEVRTFTPIADPGAAGLRIVAFHIDPRDADAWWVVEFLGRGGTVLDTIGFRP